MRFGLIGVWFSLVLAAPCFGTAHAGEAASLRLVPFPKHVQTSEGAFRVDEPLVLQLPKAAAAAGRAFVVDELVRAGRPASEVRTIEGDEMAVLLSADGKDGPALPALRAEAGSEDYALEVTPAGAVVAARDLSGLIHGMATLGQLIRANRRDGAIPCVTIHDWPSVRWRAFQDDLTRGPSTKFTELKRDIARGAMLKLNLFTYYMQHQYAFSKHPLIGPKDGSLTPAELAGLVEHGRPLGVEILGNQQSFAHMQHTLAHPEYAHLKQDDRTLSPVNEGTYRLLDDLYSEVIPILPFEMFNVCCDETWGLGLEGPTKALGDEIGPGGVYVRHIQRVYDLVHGKYGKRMMMWGDVILNHPDKLESIPKDVVMLTWGYGPKESFEDQIVPFAKSGYEFFVCPGVNNWSRVLPNFQDASVNIQNFIRDGVKHGALGMLNTTWDDDGENLNAPNWYGFAWSAECAWNGSTTPREDFDRRVGAVLLGESGDDYGQAIKLLSQPGLGGMMNRQFWDATTGLVRPEAKEAAEKNLRIAREAIVHLMVCRSTATVDADLLDSMLFGARRLEHYYQGQLDRIVAAAEYDRAVHAQGQQALTHLELAQEAIGRTADGYRRLRQQWEELWNRENKPHALDLTLARYDEALGRCEALLARLGEAREAAKAGSPLPSVTDADLRLWKKPEKLARPGRIESSLKNYQDYYPDFAFDGDPQTFYWSDRGLVAGDHFTLLLDPPAELKKVTILLGTDRYRAEYIHTGKLEAQDADGNWTEVAELKSAQVEAELPAGTTKAIRLRADAPQKFWLIIREIQLE
ncbi:MAG: glycoside hydrolase family 20 zincin-like fold domain-containing protein [Thermoguttaceae bacterium]